MATERRPLFGFAVQRFEEGSGGPFVPPRWAVNLPHQCGAWDIAGEDEWSAAAVEHSEAVEALNDFIVEAQAALTALVTRKEFRNGAARDA